MIDAQVFAELQASAGEEFVAELIDTFADEVPGMLAALRSAFAAGDADAFRRAAHSLKSNSNTFGASGLAERARELERGGLPASAAPIDALAREMDHGLAALKALARGAAGG